MSLPTTAMRCSASQPKLLSLASGIIGKRNLPWECLQTVFTIRCPATATPDAPPQLPVYNGSGQLWAESRMGMQSSATQSGEPQAHLPPVRAAQTVEEGACLPAIWEPLSEISSLSKSLPATNRHGAYSVHPWS